MAKKVKEDAKKAKSEPSAIEKIQASDEHLCKHTKADGKPCGAVRLKGQDSCWFHSPDHRKQVKDATLAGKGHLPHPRAFAEKFKLDGQPLSFDGYPFMPEVYETVTPIITMMKGTQCGATLSAMVRSFWFHKKFSARTRRRIIWTMPSDSEVREFSSDRIESILEENKGLFKKKKKKKDGKEVEEKEDWIDNVKMRQVGNGIIYLRGTKGKTQHISVPADMLIHDELDFSVLSVIKKYRSRLGASEFGWYFYISTPTKPGIGIHAEFLKSDQRHWYVYCSECNEPHRICCEGIDLIDEETGDYHCKHCGGVLNRETGDWIPDVPERSAEHAGFHITRTMLPRVSGAALLNERDNYSSEEDFFNFVLGLPYETGDNRISELALRRCFSTNYNLHAADTTPCTMGIDQGGKHIFIIISKRDARNRRQVVWVQQPELKTAFDSELDLMMNQFNIVRCVIDGIPNINSAKNFAEKYPGRVFIHFNNDKIFEHAQWKEEGDHPQVVSNKAIMMDKMVEGIMKGNLRIPDEIKTKVVLKHMGNMRREIVETRSGQRARWFSIAADHFSDAMLYDYLAGMGEPGRELDIVTLEDDTKKKEEKSLHDLLDELLDVEPIEDVFEYRIQKNAGRMTCDMILSEPSKKIFTRLEQKHGVRKLLDIIEPGIPFRQTLKLLKENRNVTAKEDSADAESAKPQSTQSAFSIETIVPST